MGWRYRIYDSKALEYEWCQGFTQTEIEILFFYDIFWLQLVVKGPISIAFHHSLTKHIYRCSNEYILGKNSMPSQSLESMTAYVAQF